MAADPMRRFVVPRRLQDRGEVAPATDEAAAPPQRRHGRIRDEEAPERPAKASRPWLQGWRSIASAVVASGLLAALAWSDVPVERIDAVARWIVACLALAVGGKDIPGAVAALRTLAEARVIGAARTPREP